MYFNTDIALQLLKFKSLLLSECRMSVALGSMKSALGFDIEKLNVTYAA